MKKLLWVFAVLFFVNAGKVRAQIASFSFSKASVTASYNWTDLGWTNVYGDPYTGIRTATANGITISSISRLNWSTNGTSCANDLQGAMGGTYFPEHIFRCQWAQSGATSAFSQGYPQLQLSGLNKDSFYIIRMSTSSVYSVGDPMLYTVSGRTLYPSQNLYAFNNTATGVTFQQIYPDSDGVINVYVNTTQGKTFAALSGLQVFTGRSTVGIPGVIITSPDNNDVLAEESSVTINATASEIGSAISKVEFYVDTTKIGQSTTAPYQCTWTNPEAGTHTLTAKATDTSGTTGISVINVNIESLSSFWSMTGNINANADSNFLGTVDTNRLAFRTNNIERMSISKEGNVTIGAKDTSNHTTMRIYSNGGVLLPRLTNAQRNAIASTNLKSGLLLYNSDSSLFQYYNGSTWNSVGSGSGSSGRWLFNATANTAYDSTDNIAIGINDAKGYKLAVKGTALFTRVQVLAANNWPDYVFRKEYRLRKLEDLASYIDKYHHLPEIVSAAKVGKDGFDLGANQAAILKKVEELTLYLIDENRRLSSQNSELEGQSKKIVTLEMQIAEQNALFQQQQREIDELKALIKKK